MIMDAPRHEDGNISEFLRILSTAGWDDLSPGLLSQAMEKYFSASWSVIYSVDPGTQTAELLTGYNLPAGVEVPSRWSHIIVRDVIKAGLGVCSEMREKDPGYSIMSFPLFISGLILGVLILGRPLNDPFSEEAIEDSYSLSPFAALFLSNLLAMDRINKNRSRFEEEHHELKKINIELGEDVKKLKKNSVRLEKAFKNLSEASKAKNEYFENLSHELRTPLTPILASSEALLGKNFGNMTDEQKEVVDILFLSAKKMELLIEDLLEMVKLESSSMKMEKECLDVKGIIDESILETAPIARDKQVKMINELDNEIPLVSGDKKRLSQLFVNLLHNAIKFSHEGGTITIRQDSEKESNGFLGISVNDRGVGIPAEVLGRIFDRFYQAGRDKSGSGLGLGLAIVKKIVEAHEGELVVQSQEGKGSTFTAYLPEYHD